MSDRCVERTWTAQSPRYSRQLGTFFSLAWVSELRVRQWENISDENEAASVLIVSLSK